MPQRTNTTFYEQLTRDAFEAVVRAKGLHEHADYRTPQIQSLLSLGPMHPKSILVVGAGYGRDLTYLWSETDIQRIDAVEVCHRYYRHLWQLSEDLERLDPRPHKKFRPFEENIGTCNPWVDGEYDIAFWMFAGILELSEQEKEGAVKRLFHMLKPGGHVVVDLPVGPITSTFDMSHPESDSVDLRGQSDGRARLRLGPVVPETGEVDLDRIKRDFIDQGRFAVVEHYKYPVDTDPPQRRETLIFAKSLQPGPAV